MSGIPGVEGAEGASASFGAQSSAIMTDKEAFSLLGSMRETVHKKAVELQNVVPPYQGQQRILSSLLLGGMVVGLSPPVAIMIVGLGIASAVLEAAVGTGVYVAAGAVAQLTRPPDQ